MTSPRRKVGYSNMANYGTKFLGAVRCSLRTMLWKSSFPSTSNPSRIARTLWRGGVRILATGSRWPARFLSTLLNDTPTPTSGTCRSIIILRPAVFQTNSNAVALVESFCMRKETIVKYYRWRSHSHLSRGFAVYFHKDIAVLASSIPPTAATAH